MTMGTRKAPPLAKRREVTKMEKPDDVAAMLRLEAAGWAAAVGRGALAVWFYLASGLAGLRLRRSLGSGSWRALSGGWVRTGRRRRAGGRGAAWPRACGG